MLHVWMRARFPHLNVQQNCAGPYKNQLHQVNRQSDLEVQSRTMQSNICFLLLLGLAVAQALPASPIDRESVSDELKIKDPEIEEVSDDKSRSKKSTSFCVEVRSDNKDNAQVPNGVQVVPVQGVNLIPQVQSYSLQVPSAQTMSMVQAPQAVQQQSVVVPQQVAQPIQTLQIVQQTQPCPQHAVNIIPSQPSVNVVPSQQFNIVEHQPEPTPAPTPKPTTQPPAKIVAPQPKPQKLVVPQTEVVETVNIVPVPVQAPCKERVFVVPSKPMVLMPEPERLATLIKVPHCPHVHQGIVGQCSCRQHGLTALSSASRAVDPMHIMYKSKMIRDMV